MISVQTEDSYIYSLCKMQFWAFLSPRPLHTYYIINIREDATI